MTISAVVPTADTPGSLVAALREVVFSGRFEQQLRIRRVVTDLQACAGPDLAYAQRARGAYDQLREVVAALGPSRELAADLPTLFALGDWSAVAAPDLAPILSPHFYLVTSAIMRLGNGSPYQKALLDRLDDASSVGAILLTELGYGSNVRDLETEAAWDRATGRFVLTTPSGTACKFMPNVGADDVPKVTIVVARLMVNGKDEGIFPFLVALRTEEGLASGIKVIDLPDKGFAPMDNTMIRFEGLSLPYDAWLTGGIAAITAEGDLDCSVPVRDRIHATLDQLQAGRIALSAGALAGARAGLYLTTRYARQRRTSGGVPMLARDNVRRALASRTSQVYAATAVANVVRNQFIDAPADSLANALLAMVAKPVLSYTALAVLQECRERCGSQGFFRLNRISDYLGNAQGAITAEGENQVLQIATGRILTSMPAARDWTTIGVDHDNVAWWHQLLVIREKVLMSSSAPLDQAAGVVGPSCQAMDVAAATADRLAADAMHLATCDAPRPARHLLDAVAAVHALEIVQAHGTWFTAHGHLTSERAAQIQTELAAGYHVVADQLPALVEAFATPDLPAPIADDYITTWLRYAGWQQATSRLQSDGPDTQPLPVLPEAL